MLGRKHHAGTKSQRHMIVSLLAVAFSVLLMTQVNVWQILVSLALLAVGVPVYVFFSPKSEMHELKEMLLSREAILRRAYRQSNVFLAYALRRIKWLIYRAKGIQRAWKVQDET